MEGVEISDGGVGSPEARFLRPRRGADDAVHRRQLTESAIEMEVDKYLSYRVAWMQ